MNDRRDFLLGTAGLLLAGPAILPAQEPKKKETEDEAFFRGDKLRKWTITVDEENLKILKRDPRKYVRANVTDSSRGLSDVGLHLKGAAGSFRGFEDRPALTLNFNKFVKRQLYRDLDKLHLNNSVQDPSFLTELFCGEIAREAGVPAARATHCVLELNGKKLGLYVVKEGFDSLFLKRYFKNVHGNLYDGGFLTDIDGDLKNSHEDEGERNADLKAVVKVCRENDQAKRWEGLEKLLDLPRFISLMACESLTCHWDGYCQQRNNYRVYHDPDSNKLTFFMHGMDQMFGNPGHTIDPATGGMVSRAIWEHPEGKKRYNARVREIYEKQFKTEAMHKRIDELVKQLKPFIEQNTDKGFTDGWLNQVNELKNRIKQRNEVLAKHFDPKKK